MHLDVILVNDRLDALFFSVEAWNKYIEEECVKLVINQN
jgi:hypothetical protein